MKFTSKVLGSLYGSNGNGVYIYTNLDCWNAQTGKFVKEWKQIIGTDETPIFKNNKQLYTYVYRNNSFCQSMSIAIEHMEN